LLSGHALDPSEILLDLLASEPESRRSAVRANGGLSSFPESVQDETNFLRSQRGVDFDRGMTSDSRSDSPFRLGDRGSSAILLPFSESGPYELAGIQAGKGRRNRSDHIASTAEVLDVETIRLNPNHFFIERNLLGCGELELQWGEKELALRLLLARSHQKLLVENALMGRVLVDEPNAFVIGRQDKAFSELTERRRREFRKLRELLRRGLLGLLSLLRKPSFATP